LIHGLGGDAGFWQAELKDLARHYRVLAVDLRGFGESVGGWQAFSIDEFAADVVAVLDAAGIATAHIIGFSMGGLVAQALVINAPDRVSSLTLAATFATTNLQSRLFLTAVGAVYCGGASPKQIYDLILPWLFSAEFLTSPRAEPFIHHDEEESGESARSAWLRSLEAQLSFDSRERLAGIDVPTLIICGEEDCLATRGDAEELLAGIRGAELKIIPGGHLMNIESPKVFMSCIESFLHKASS